MEIPFADLSWYYKEYSSEINSAISKVLSSGSYVLGEEVEAFEHIYCQSSAFVPNWPYITIYHIICSYISPNLHIHLHI